MAVEDLANPLVPKERLQEVLQHALERQRVQHEAATPARELHHAHLVVVTLDVDPTIGLSCRSFHRAFMW